MFEKIVRICFYFFSVFFLVACFYVSVDYYNKTHLKFHSNAVTKDGGIINVWAEVYIDKDFFSPSSEGEKVLQKSICAAAIHLAAKQIPLSDIDIAGRRYFALLVFDYAEGGKKGENQIAVQILRDFKIKSIEITEVTWSGYLSSE